MRPSNSSSAPSTLSRPFSRDKADTLLLIGACSLVLLPHLPHLPLWSAVACTLLLGWRVWITLRGKRLPPRWLLLPLSIAVGAGVFLTYRTFFGREPGVMMLALLLALKLLEMHAKRDVFVVVFLGFFLMLTSFFHSQSIGAAALMIAAVTLMLSAQLSFQYTGASPSLWRRLSTSLRIVGLAFPLTAILFLLFPRIDGPLWRLPGDAHGGRTGLSNTMSPGNISNLAQSEAIAFRAKFETQAPPKSSLYWRGPVLEYYDGRTWMEATSVTGTPPAILHTMAPPLRYQVTLEPHGQPWLMTLEMPQSPPAVQGNPARITSEWRIVTTRPIQQRLRYDATSYLGYALERDSSLATFSPWLQLPAGYNPQALAFAAQLSSRHEAPSQRIDAVLQHFREQPFSYTLQPPLLGRHTVDDFLFSTRAGFCEHYASAFVVLMRAMGIPARVVTGYQGGEVNTVDGYLVVRQSDAHAWAEVWLHGRGWVRVDPTAAVAPDRINMSLNRAIPQPLLGGWVNLTITDDSWLAGLHRLQQQWGQMRDAVGNTWNQWILNYTQERQQSLMRMLGLNKADWRMLALLMVIFGMATIGLTALLLLRTRPTLPPLERMYRTLCEAMREQGYPKAAHEGPRDYATRLTAADSTLPYDKQIAASRFLVLYESIRYGAPEFSASGNKTSPAVVSQLQSLLRECK